MIQAKYETTNLTNYVRKAAQSNGIAIVGNLVLLYWNNEGNCIAFCLEDHNRHFSVPLLWQMYNNYSEIINI